MHFERFLFVTLLNLPTRMIVSFKYYNYIYIYIYWKKHVDIIAIKLSKVVSIIHLLKYSLTIKSLKLIYNTY